MSQQLDKFMGRMNTSLETTASRNWRRGIFFFVFSASTMATTPAFAELHLLAAPKTEAQQADELFRQGRDAMAKKEYEKALTLFQTSHKLAPGVGKLANIAICEEKLGKVASAFAHFQLVAGELPSHDTRRPTIDKYLSDLPQRLPYLRIVRAPNVPAGSTITLDGAALASTNEGVDMPIDPGKHQVVITPPNAPPKQYDVLAEEGKRTVLTMETVENSKGPVVPPNPDILQPDTGRRSLVPVVVLGAATIAGIAVGAAFITLRENKRSDAVALGSQMAADGSACVEGAENFDAARCKTLFNLTSTGDVFGNLSWVGFGGAVLAAAGGITYALWPNSPPRASSPKTSTSTRETQSRPTMLLSPVLTRETQGMTLIGVF